MKRIGLFLATNLAIEMVLSVTIRMPTMVAPRLPSSERCRCDAVYLPDA